MPDLKYSKSPIKTKIQEAVKDVLTESEYLVLSLNYGFIDGKLYTVDEISQMLSCNPVVTAKILNEAMEKLTSLHLFEEIVIPKNNKSV